MKRLEIHVTVARHCEGIKKKNVRRSTRGNTAWETIDIYIYIYVYVYMYISVHARIYISVYMYM